jgi:hypothetical protein
MPKTVTRFCSDCGKAIRFTRKGMKKAIREFGGHRPTGSCCAECYNTRPRFRVEYRPE